MTLINSRTLKDRIVERVEDILEKAKTEPANEKMTDKIYASGMMAVVSIINELSAEVENE